MHSPLDPKTSPSTSKAKPVSSGMHVPMTLLENAEGPLSKTISLDGGKPASSAQGNLTSGTATPLRLAGLEGLAAQISGMSSHQALALGRLKVEPPQGQCVPVVVKSALREAAAGAIARDKEHLIFASGEPGFMLLDIDLKGMSEDAEARLEDAGDPIGAVLEVAPGLAQAGRVERASTSAGLSVPGKTFASSGGLHVYIPVADASDIPRATKTLHKRLVLGGFGWGMVSKAGSFLERSPVDRSVGSPERLVFEGPPILRDGLEQDPVARKPRVTNGETVDTWQAIPDLDPEEEAEYRRIVSGMKADLDAEMGKVRKSYNEARAKEIVARTGKSYQQALETLEQRHSEALTADMLLYFDALGPVTAGQVVDNPERFVGETLADPFEPDQPNKAKVLWGKFGDVVIHSFMHGGAVYVLEGTPEYRLAQAKAAFPDFTIEELLARIVELEATVAGKAEALSHAGYDRADLKQALEDFRKADSKEASRYHEEVIEVYDRDTLDRPLLKQPHISERHTLGTLSLTVAAGGTGKTTLAVLTALAITYERPDLLGLPGNQEKFDCQGDVVLVLNEDLARTRALLKAAEKANGLRRADMKHRILIYPRRLVLMEKRRNGAVPTKQAVDFVKWLTEHQRKKSIALIVFDTLGSVSGGIDENSAGDMGLLCRLLEDIVEAGFCAGDIVHHTNKAADAGGDGDKAWSYRGSGALGAAVRSMSVLVPVKGGKGMLKLKHVKANSRAPAPDRFFMRVTQWLPAENPHAPDADDLESYSALKLVEKPEDDEAVMLEKALDALKVVAAKGIVLRDGRSGQSSGPGWETACHVIETGLRIKRAEAIRLLDKLIDPLGRVTRRQVDYKEGGRKGVLTWIIQVPQDDDNDEADEEA